MSAEANEPRILATRISSAPKQDFAPSIDDFLALRQPAKQLVSESDSTTHMTVSSPEPSSQHVTQYLLRNAMPHCYYAEGIVTSSQRLTNAGLSAECLHELYSLGCKALTAAKRLSRRWPSEMDEFALLSTEHVQSLLVVCEKRLHSRAQRSTSFSKVHKAVGLCYLGMFVNVAQLCRLKVCLTMWTKCLTCLSFADVLGT